MKPCIDCPCEHHVRVLIEGRHFLRCAACDRLCAPVGATIVNPDAFRDAVDWADACPKPRDNRLDVLAIVAAMIFAFLVAWNSGPQ